MSDASGANPPPLPPPPPSVPPPQFNAGAAAPNMPPYRMPAGYQAPPPGYQGPTAPDYVQPYQYAPAPQQSFSSAAGAILSSPGALMGQFGGYALYSIIAGLASIVVPFATNFYFPILPIIGLLNAVRAMQRGRLLGGLVGLVLNILGGVVSLFASGLLGS
jgi:hypothetical protein